MRSRVGTLGVLAATAFMLVAVGCSANPLPSASSSTSGSTGPGAAAPTPAAASTCTLPLTQDVYDGFHIGVPSGWDLFTLNGGVVVRRDATGTEQTEVYPVLMTAGLTPAVLFTTLLDALQKEIASLNATLTYSLTSSGNQPPIATLNLQAGPVSMIGQAILRILPEATAHGSTQGALIATWAPSAQFATESATLAAIGACYGPQPGTLYQVMQDEVFTYPIPLGWSVTIENQETLEVSDGPDAGATFAAIPTAPLNSGVNSPQTLRSYWFGQMGIKIGQVLASSQSPSTQTANGATDASELVEFSGTLKDGRAVHGQVRAETVTGRGITSGTIRLAMTTPGQWNSLNGALIHVAFSIQHSIKQDLQQWERLNRQSQAFAQQVQGFDYALTGVDLVHDPTTGATFEAPYAAYSKTGPDGPGYYSKANTRLQVQTP